MHFTRDYTMYMAIFAFFSFVWFGWAQENPRPEWRPWLAALSLLSVGLAVWGGILSVKHWQDASALNQANHFTWYLIFFYAELLLAVIGAVFLILTDYAGWVAIWVSFVVAVHFIALAFVFQDKSLFLLTAGMLLVTLAAHVLANYFRVADSAITGIGNGILLLIFALRGLILFLQSS